MKRMSFLVALLLVLIPLSATTPVLAASQITSIQIVNVQVFAAANCASGDHVVDMGIVVNGTPGGTGSYTLNTLLSGSGTPYSYSYAVPDSQLGVTTDSYGDTRLNTWYNGTGWTSLNGTAVITVTADGVGPAVLTIDCVTRAYTVVNYTAAAAVYAGPPIPAGFVLRTITCDVAVFNTPNGIPLVSGEKIKAGQTWFVNPTPVDVVGNATYPQWTEIFTSGTQNGFIPTACVGG